jgi:hypothetical protein
LSFSLPVGCQLVLRSTASNARTKALSCPLTAATDRVAGAVVFWVGPQRLLGPPTQPQPVGKIDDLLDELLRGTLPTVDHRLFQAHAQAEQSGQPLRPLAQALQLPDTDLRQLGGGNQPGHPDHRSTQQSAGHEVPRDQPDHQPQRDRCRRQGPPPHAGILRPHLFGTRRTPPLKKRSPAGRGGTHQARHHTDHTAHHSHAAE